VQCDALWLETTAGGTTLDFLARASKFNGRPWTRLFFANFEGSNPSISRWVLIYLHSHSLHILYTYIDQLTLHLFILPFLSDLGML
jgi:hypothetical protein